MESQDLVSVSRHVSRPVFWSLGLEGLRSRLDLEEFRSRSRALRLETLHRLFFMKFCKKDVPKKTVLKQDCSKFSRSNRSVAKLSLLLSGLWSRSRSRGVGVGRIFNLRSRSRRKF